MNTNQYLNFGRTFAAGLLNVPEFVVVARTSLSIVMVAARKMRAAPNFYLEVSLRYGCMLLQYGSLCEVLAQICISKTEKYSQAQSNNDDVSLYA